VRKTVALAAVGMAAWAGRRYLALRTSMSTAAPELRTWRLLVTGIPMNSLTLPLIRLLMAYKSEPGPGATKTEHLVGVPAVEVIVVTPTSWSAPLPAVLWLHGGGMCAGTARLETQPAADLARDIGAVVVLPNYRLAPENRFPAGLDDCMAALQWMTKHAGEIGIDADRIAVCGWSSGGGLAAAVAQRALDEGIPVLAQALMSPMLDDRTALRDDLAGRGELTWSPRSNRWAWTAYLGGPPRMADAPRYAAPARRVHVAGLPPAWIGVGDLEVFHDECAAYAERLTAAGVPCELVLVPGMYHTADGIARNAPSIKRFNASMADHLRTYLGASASSSA
jgi:acetyl esterase/lipase